MRLTRREFSRFSGLVLSGGFFGGCLGFPGDSTGGDPSPTETRAEIERLPESSPLANPLPDLVQAEDRAAFAEEHGLDYRTREGHDEVKVEIELEPDGEQPDKYLSEVIDAFGRLVIAWVDVDILVDLALDENVRRVQPTTEPKTD